MLMVFIFRFVAVWFDCVAVCTGSGGGVGVGVCDLRFECFGLSLVLAFLLLVGWW